MAGTPRFSAEKKVMILREHLENSVPVSQLAEKYNIHPNSIHLWKKQMFEKAVDTFSGKHKKPKGPSKKDLRKIEELKETLRKREALITEIVEDNMILRKELGGPA